ncbi:TolC family protein [Mucilaginibacter arboris]|uniref:TolC family protein n=1 Tax=Mucilaginibacter arboris TaxID=2682090 RepID=A0A7K1SX56_9SPHI|nr:TolC family protein [Mucilaginibacter arboris]MVN21818.1 TolC family protein [Mucilaginibacter arboris]
MKLTKFLPVLLLCLFFLKPVTYAQQAAPLLTLEDAVSIALKNNYNIQLAKNNTAISAANVSIGNAGYLPVLTANASTSSSILNINQTRSDGTVNKIPRLHNSSDTYGPNINWTIFDGFAMFANYDQLKQLNKLSQVQQRDTIQSTLASVISTYYNLINQTQQLLALKEEIQISRLQLRYASDRYSVGRAAKLDVLNAQVNFNTDTTNFLTQIQQFNTTKINFNRLLVRKLNEDFSVPDTIVIQNQPVLADIIAQAQKSNPAILASQINKRLTEINLKQVRALRYPAIGVNSGYAFSNSTTPAGFTQTQNTKGLNYGLTASINIFDGFNQVRRERVAKLQINGAGIRASQIQQLVETQINALYIDFLSGLDLIRVGQSNVEIARQNLNITLEKYRLGNITPLEVREAQRNYLDAKTRFFTNQYQTKLSEISLKEITGNISLN